MQGFDLERSDGGSTLSENPALQSVPLFGGRNLAIALAMFVFYSQRMPKALGILLLCCIVSGTVDTVVTSSLSMDGSAWTHAIGTVVLGSMGWILLG